MEQNCVSVMFDLQALCEEEIDSITVSPSESGSPCSVDY